MLTGTLETKTPKIPWNKGRIVGPKAPLKLKHIWGIRAKLKIAGKCRDLALFDMAIDSKLRGCDLVKLRVGDVVIHGEVKSRASIVQQKTGRPVQFEITEQTRASVQAWLSHIEKFSDSYLFPSRIDHSKPMTTRQYARLVEEWIESIELDRALYGTHTMRRTKASMIYKRTGNLRAVQLLLGHTKLESTVRYLGVEVDDALLIAEQTEI
jgi:integrase